MTNREVILVTGSSGFIGGWIVETLYLDRSATIRAGIRSWASAARLGRFPVEMVLCDVMDKESIRHAMDGVDRVIHCASGSSEGPVSKDWSIGFAQKLQSGNWGIFKEVGEGFCNLVYVADVVTGILLAARDDRAIGQAFNLVGPERITWNDYFQRFNAALNLPELIVVHSANARIRSILMGPLRNFGKFILNHFRASIRKISQRYRPARLLMQFVDRTMKTIPRATELSLFNREAIYLDNKAQELLGYQPSIGVERGLDLSVGWLRMVGLADRSKGGG
jgi:nucleoside-diphosphate-sugar epimerase